MKRIPALLSVLAIAATPADAATPELRTLFPQQAELYAESDRMSRLELPPEVVSACRGDLADLRVFDREGREVPFLIDGGLPLSPPEAHLELRQSFIPELLETARRQLDREDAPALRHETYELTTPAEDSPGGGSTTDAPTGSWELVVETGNRHFVRRVSVTALADDGSPSSLLEDGSLFRLLDPPREKLRLPLPAFAAPRLRVVLAGEDGFYLEPGFRFENARPLAGRQRAVVELRQLSRHHDGRRTLLEVARPRGLVPGVLRLATATGAFNRPVEVWDEGPGSRGAAADDALGRRVLFRLRALTTVEELEIPLRPARGDRLRVVITDGDSPPLDDLVVSAVVRRPALLLALPAIGAGDAGGAGDAAPAGILRFGGGRAFPPQYDLADLLPRGLPATGSDSEVAQRLYDPALLGEIRLGTIAANPHFDPAPVLAFAHRAGSAIDPRFYRYRRQLAVTPSAEGLVRLRLTAEDLARARPDLADLRIVDPQSRQWAYLLENDAAEEIHALTPPAAESRASRDRTSFYPLPLPAGSVRPAEIVLETATPFFDRAFELVAAGEPREIVLARGRLVRRIGDPRPVAIPCAAARRVEALELRIEDGDDAPLELLRIEVRLPVPELYFAAPAGDYALLLGNPDDRAPRYELERVRDVVLAVASAGATAGALAENPDYSTGARFAGERGAQQLLLWVALAAAVVVLTLLTLRLARRDGG